MLRLLRISSFLEGVSFLLLVLIAMPLKYVFHIPEAVTYVGWAHGILFMGLYGLLFLALIRGVISFKMAALTACAALLPAAPFFLDRRYRELEQQAASSQN